MKADIGDAPTRVNRKRHKHGVFYTVICHLSSVICLLAGSIATFGAAQLISRVSSFNSPYKQTMSPTGRDEEQTRTSDMPPRQGLESSRLRALSEMHLAPSTSRQTAFNDQNYIPRGADNVVAFRVGSDPDQGKESAKEAKLTIVRQPASMKERACWLYRQGSIESRNCRASIGLNH